MTLHLVKLCVGATSIDDLASWQKKQRAFKRKDGTLRIFHATFQTPKREAELTDGGSLYWVIKGAILVRQPIAGLSAARRADGTPCCHILLQPDLIAVRPVPRRAFQGWRYLDPADAPPDLGRGQTSEVAAMPPAMRRDLAALGLI